MREAMSVWIKPPVHCLSEWNWISNNREKKWETTSNHDESHVSMMYLLMKQKRWVWHNCYIARQSSNDTSPYLLNWKIQKNPKKWKWKHNVSIQSLSLVSHCPTHWVQFVHVHVCCHSNVPRVLIKILILHQRISYRISRSIAICSCIDILPHS